MGTDSPTPTLLQNIMQWIDSEHATDDELEQIRVRVEKKQAEREEALIEAARKRGYKITPPTRKKRVRRKKRGNDTPS